jgi:hypothetical protein
VGDVEPLGRLRLPADVGAHRADQPHPVLELAPHQQLDVAGNRESVDRGIGERVERFMLRVFRQLGRGAD